MSYKLPNAYRGGFLVGMVTSIIMTVISVDTKVTVLQFRIRFEASTQNKDGSFKILDIHSDYLRKVDTYLVGITCSSEGNTSYIPESCVVTGFLASETKNVAYWTYSNILISKRAT